MTFRPDDSFKAELDSLDVQIAGRLKAEAANRLALDALKSIETWWRLPNAERTVNAIEPAMGKVLEALEETTDKS